MKKPRRGTVREISAPQAVESANDGIQSAASTEGPSTPIAPEFAATAPTAISDDEIRRRAYELYERREGREGDDLADWLTAEQELKRLSSI